MRFEHRDGEKARSAISLGPVRDTVPVVDGVFEVSDERDDIEDVLERLTEAGHTPLEDTATADDAVKDDPEADDAEADIPEAGEFSEQQLVEQLDYREKQTIAKQYDGIDGSASDEKLTEELIKQRREEVDE